MNILVLALAIFCSGVGAFVYVANSRRFTNQVFLIISVLIALWLCIVSEILSVAPLAPLVGSSELVRLLRVNAVVAAFVPWAVWMLKESILVRTGVQVGILKRSFFWLMIGLVLTALCFTDSFISWNPNDNYAERGAGYIVYTLIGFVAYGALTVKAYKQMISQVGIRRVEMQFLVLNLSITCLLMVLFTGVGNVFQIAMLKRLSLVLFLLFYMLTAWTISLYRIYDAKQIYISLAQRLGVVGVSGIVAWCIWWFAMHATTPYAAQIVSVAIWSCIAFWLDGRSREWLGLDGGKSTAQLRADVIDIGRSGAQCDKLIEAFSKLLRAICKTSLVSFKFVQNDGNEPHSSRIEVKERPAYDVLSEIGWATPESLERRRETPELIGLREMMEEEGFSLILSVPQGSPTPSLVLALGTKANRWPYTYPEVQRLQNIAELMNNLLTHSRLMAQAALRAKMEHLALVSRGLAHDLKNLITPMAAYLVHSEGRLRCGSVEEEAHAEARRSVRIMTDYICDALFFGRKLELSLEVAPVRRILALGCESTASQAEKKRVLVTVTVADSLEVMADVVLLQRVISNLVINAIDASEPGGVVRLSADRGSGGRVWLQVSDTGCGIGPENLGRIFDPYFTTKEFGNDTRGFGLGLTICRKILDLHEGTLSVVSEIGRGTTFTVELPGRRSLPVLGAPLVAATLH